MAQETVSPQDTVSKSVKVITGIVAVVITGWTEWHFGLAKAAALTQKSSSVFLLGFQSFTVKYATQHPTGASAYILLLGIMFCVGYKVAALFGGPVSILRKLSPRIDDSVVKPIPPLRAWDPLWGPGFISLKEKNDDPLPWVLPAIGTPRRALYNALKDFVRTGVGSSKHGPWGKPDDLTKPFLWKVLTGRSGSGKTRIALEFMQRELVRQPQMERLKRRSWQLHLRVRLGQWLRHVSRFHARRANDPWDVGWLKPYIESGSVNEHRERKSNDSIVTGLEGWLPRRPTLLLLDDPLYDGPAKVADCADVIKTLNAQVHEYRFPVRLLIVNQSVPLDVSFYDEDGKDKSKTPNFHGPLLEVNESCGLTTDEIAKLVEREIDRIRLDEFARHRPKWLDNPADLIAWVEAISKTTEGNPMMVELAVRWIREDKSLEKLTLQALINDRAERVWDDLKDHGRDVNCLVASATLAGPVGATNAYMERLSKSAKRTSDNTREALLGQHEILYRCRNLADGLGRGGDGSRLPAVRPLRVGEAYVRRVIHAYLPETTTAKKIVTDAWWLNAEGVLSTVGRLASYGDVLGEALRADPPHKVAVDSVEHTLALTRAASLRAVDMPWAYAGNALEPALAKTQALQMAQAHAFLEGVVGEKGLWHGDRRLFTLDVWALAYPTLVALTKLLPLEVASSLSPSNLSLCAAQIEPLITAWVCELQYYSDYESAAQGARP